MEINRTLPTSVRECYEHIVDGRLVKSDLCWWENELYLPREQFLTKIGFTKTFNLEMFSLNYGKGKSDFRNLNNNWKYVIF